MFVLYQKKHSRGIGKAGKHTVTSTKCTGIEANITLNCEEGTHLVTQPALRRN